MHKYSHYSKKIAALELLQKRKMLFMPVALLCALLFIVIFPVDSVTAKKTAIRTFDVARYPVITAIEQTASGKIVSAYVRTPAGARRITQAEGMRFLTQNVITCHSDQDDRPDLLWRMCFMGFDGNGINLWMSMLTWQPKVFIDSTPARYTKWHAIPAKLDLPLGTAVYIAPATPFYSALDRQYSGTDSYSFVYTMRLTPEGLRFIPIPSAYNELAFLLHAGMQGEASPRKRLAYLKMLSEFKRLADGKAPTADTLVNLPIEHIDTLAWKR